MSRPGDTGLRRMRCPRTGCEWRMEWDESRQMTARNAAAAAWRKHYWSAHVPAPIIEVVPLAALTQEEP